MDREICEGEIKLLGCFIKYLIVNYKKNTNYCQHKFTIIHKLQHYFLNPAKILRCNFPASKKRKEV
jgi:Zn-dependent peptidase ImmA (M78 family)